jgi:hypothetical protein
MSMAPAGDPSSVNRRRSIGSSIRRLFVDGVGIEAVGDDELRPRFALRIQRRNRPGFIVAQPFAELRICQVFITVSRGGPDPNAARACVSDDAIFESGIERAPCVRVDLFEPRVGIRVVADAEVEPALAQRHQPTLPFVLQR